MKTSLGVLALVMLLQIAAGAEKAAATAGPNRIDEIVAVMSTSPMWAAGGWGRLALPLTASNEEVVKKALEREPAGYVVLEVRRISVRNSVYVLALIKTRTGELVVDEVHQVTDGWGIRRHGDAWFEQLAKDTARKASRQEQLQPNVK